MMQFFFYTLLLAAAQGALGTGTTRCHADNCARAVTGTRAGLPPMASRMAECSSFMKITILPSTTIAPNQVPASYARDCPNSSRYSSACSCWGIGPFTTYPPSATTTHRGVIQVLSAGASLGYIQPDANYWTPMLTPAITSALIISFELPQGATSGNQLNFKLENDNRGVFLGLVVGRDSTSSDISPGSFNYLYLDPVSSPGTLPGSTPQSIPSYFSTSTGLDKQAETSVWSVNLLDGTIACTWINTDSSSPAPATIEFVQSNHVYAGGDPVAFQNKFPAPVTIVTFKFIPV